MNATLQSTFDYATLEESKRLLLQKKAKAIKTRMKRSARDIVAIGQDLIEVKEALGHGQFLAWIKAEFDMTEMTAVRFMQVANRFGKSNKMLDFPVSVLYALAAPSTTDEIAEKVFSGEIPPDTTSIREAKEAQRNRATIEAAKKEAGIPRLILPGTQPEEEQRRQEIIKVNQALTENVHKLLQYLNAVYDDQLRALGMTGTLECVRENLLETVHLIDEILQRAKLPE